MIIGILKDPNTGVSQDWTTLSVWGITHCLGYYPFLECMLTKEINRGNLLRTKEINRGNLLRWPSCHHVWRRVMLPPDLFTAKRLSNFVKRILPFCRELKSCMYVGYCVAKYSVTIMCA